MSFLITQLFFDLVFVVDIVLNFRTTYFNRDGDQEFRITKITRHYLASGGFFVDAITVLPYDLINYSSLKALSLLKMIRIKRLPRIISGSYMKQHYKNILRVIQLVFQLILTFHFCACVWAYIVQFSKEWIPPKDYLDYTKSDYFRAGVSKKYFTAMYYAILSLNGGEIGPRNTLENIFASLIVMSGALIYANLFGTMMLHIENLRSKELQIQLKIDSLSYIISRLNLSKYEAKLIHSYILKTEGTLIQQRQLNEFMNKVSPSVKCEILSHIFSNSIRQNIIVKRYLDDFLPLTHGSPIPRIEINSSEAFSPTNRKETMRERQFFLEFIVQRFSPVLLRPEELVIEYKDTSSEMYFISSGALHVHQRSISRKVLRPFCRLKQGDHFGQVGLLLNCRRTMQIAAEKYTTVASLSYDSLQQIFQNYSNFRTLLLDQIISYKDKLKITLRTLLQQVPYFQNCSIQNILRIIYSFNILNLRQGDYLFREHQEVHGIYILIKGKLDLCFTTEQIIVPIYSCKLGAIINYDRIVLPSAYKVSALCRSDAVVALLDIQTFERLYQEIQELKQAVDRQGKAIEKKDCRPYPIDVFEMQKTVKVAKFQPKKLSQFARMSTLRKNKPNRQLINYGRSAPKFKFKNVVLHLVNERRQFRKVVPLKERILSQIQRDRFHFNVHNSMLTLQNANQSFFSDQLNKSDQVSKIEAALHLDRLELFSFSKQIHKFRYSSLIMNTCDWDNYFREIRKLNEYLYKIKKLMLLHSRYLEYLEKVMSESVDSCSFYLSNYLDELEQEFEERPEIVIQINSLESDISLVEESKFRDESPARQSFHQAHPLQILTQQESPMTENNESNDHEESEKSLILGPRDAIHEQEKPDQEQDKFS